ncbi:hypothetical protein D3C81_117910 [compost metagenome]
MDSLIFSVPRSDVTLVENALTVWGIDYRHHVTLAFDSAEPIQWVELIVEVVKSPAAMNCLSAAIGYFIARNKGKFFEVTMKNGTKVTVKGHDLDATIALLKEAERLAVKDENPDNA